MSDPFASATDALTLLQNGELSSRELTLSYLERIAELNPRINAFLGIEAEDALARADRIDRDRAAGKPLGLLAGLPVAVKDVLCTAGQVTTCGSRMLENYIPPYDATVVAKLKAADAVLVGKTNMDEFAMGGSNENSAFGSCRNPWDLSRAPGGSSGGSAACVAAGMTPVSIGTDTGGSIRQPAAFCGIVGLKPSYGRVSRYGLIAYASSLDQAGVFARSAADAALLLEVIAGHDPADSTSVERPVPRFSQSVESPLEGLRIGVVREHRVEGLDAEVQAAVDESLNVFRSLGAAVREISMPHSEFAIATYYVIAPCEASSNLARYDGVHYGYRASTEEPGEPGTISGGESPLVQLYCRSRSDGFGPEVKRRIMLGTYALSAGYYDAYYLKAQKVRRLIRDDYLAAFREVDLIAGPTTARPAFGLGEKVDDPLAMYLEDLFTVGANLAGVAGISIPGGLSRNNLPIGLQLQAPSFEEDRLLRAAHMFQLATDWHQKRPELD